MLTSPKLDLDQLRAAITNAAASGLFIGTSSWKYPGWCGQIYDPARYVYRNRFSESRFNKTCLSEYAETFRTVCVDAAYYKFPDRHSLDGLFASVPSDFRFSFKVTDEITIKKFTNLPRFGARAGQANENFLNADLLASAFLRTCEPFRERIGALMFEFSKFYPSDFARGRDFVEVLEQFLAKLPKDWRYAVEIRNKHFLKPEYFAALARHGVAHVFNSWQDMPAISEQLALSESLTSPEFCVARFLLKPGRKYEEAVKLFSPYDRLREPDESGRSAGTELIRRVVTQHFPKHGYVYVNNRFEGNAIQTIVAMLQGAGVI